MYEQINLCIGTSLLLSVPTAYTLAHGDGDVQHCTCSTYDEIVLNAKKFWDDRLTADLFHLPLPYSFLEYVP